MVSLSPYPRVRSRCNWGLCPMSPPKNQVNEPVLSCNLPRFFVMKNACVFAKAIITSSVIFRIDQSSPTNFNMNAIFSVKHYTVNPLNIIIPIMKNKQTYHKQSLRTIQCTLTVHIQLDRKLHPTVHCRKLHTVHIWRNL